MSETKTTTSQSPAPRTEITFSARDVMDLYLRGDHDAVSERFLHVLEGFSERNFRQFSPDTKLFFDSFFANFLNLFVQPDFSVGDQFVKRYIKLNRVIADLVALTVFGNTDAFLELLRPQAGNFVKVLTLYSARNRVSFDRAEMIALHPEFFSLWYAVFASGYLTGVIRPEVVENLKEHLRFIHPLLRPIHQCHEIYFGSTYVDGVWDRTIKGHVNAIFRDVMHPVQSRIVNRPVREKIAVVSGSWRPSHAVYRNYHQFVKTLKPKYHITFLQLGHPDNETDLSLFDVVQPMYAVKGNAAIEPLLRNDFALAYFPDIGMNEESIALANLRIAPVQVTSPGHSVSTWGAEIDYWISGADVEPAGGAERNYSERLVLLPGFRVIHNPPIYVPTGRRKTISEIVINCSWHSQKVNYQFCQTLREVIRRSRRPIRLRVFLGTNFFMPFARDLSVLLGPQHVECLGGLSYQEYMSLMEEGDFGLDSFHFGGCNTVADSLFLRKPMIVWEGDKWYNRIGPAMLRQIGLGELIATNEKEYLELALRLIEDDAYRDDLTRRLAGVDLDATIFSDAHAPQFAKAIDYLIDNHERLKAQGERSPIRLEP